jgi:hypothetical protein
MSNEKEVKDILAIDPGTENVNRFDGLLHKVQQGDVNASKSVYKGGEDFTPMCKPDPDGTAEHLGRKIDHVPDYETFEDEFVISETLAEENEREWKTYEAFREIILDPSGLGRFDRIKQVIIEKDVRIFDKMSRRRKKIYVSRLAFYETATGKYTTRKYKGRPGFKLRPIRMCTTETYGGRLDALLKEWCELL